MLTAANQGIIKTIYKLQESASSLAAALRVTAASANRIDGLSQGRPARYANDISGK